MTREEAIFALEYHKIHFADKQAVEAFGMAIKALEQEQSEKKNYKSEARRWKRRYLDLKQQTRWIPVSERLPEKKGDYLVTQKASFSDYVYRSVAGYTLNLHDVDEYDFADKKRPGWYEYDSEWGYYEIDGVIAWMPLPEPYKAESEEV